jgi:hypothetical protein
MNTALLGKVGRTFVVAFLGIFLPVVISTATSISTTGDWSIAKAALVSAILAAFAGGVRAVVAVLPIFSADNNTGLSK